jgi:membrane peptidoglycan carboxypeptidase
MMQAHEEMAKFTFKSYTALQGIQAPHFVRYVVDQVLVPLLGAQNLENGGYNVYTTLDLGLEKKVEQIVYDDLYKAQQDSYFGYYGPLNITNNVNNSAAVVMNPKNGEILAMDGSANYNDNSSQVQGEYNAALALRQPGSSFKPVVYATAFEMGWYPAMIIPDHKTVFPGNLQPPYYSPQNYDGKFHTGFPMTVRAALANSFNIPAVDAIMFAGIPNVLNMAARLGLTEVASKSPKDLGPSMALGAVEVSLLHLTGAYATFANQGVRVPQVSVLQINDNQGNVLYKYNAAQAHGVRAMSQGVAFLMSSILSDKAARYHEFFPGNPLELDRPAAAKTGTTDSFRDNWTLGYTPYITTGVWAGNSDNSIMNNVIGITGAGPIWHDIMEYVSQRYNFPKDDFVKPGDVHSGTVSAITGLLPHPGEPTITDWFIDGTMPTIQGSYSYTPQGQNCDNGNCRKHGRCHSQNCNPVPIPNGQPIVPPLGPGGNGQ